MNPIRFPLFCNSREAALNCLLFRPLWHDRNHCICTHTYVPTGTHIYICRQLHACTHTHTHQNPSAQTHTHTHWNKHKSTHSIYTSNLLVMRSVLSLELREKREDMEERRKRDESRGGQQRKSHVMFSQWRSRCVRVCDCEWVAVQLQDMFLHFLCTFL